MYRSILLIVSVFGIFASLYAGPQPDSHPVMFALSWLGILFLTWLMYVTFDWKRAVARLNLRLMRLNERVWRHLDNRRQR